MAIAWPLAEHAQKTAKIPRLDFFLPFTPADAGAWHFFLRGLVDLGWVDGKNIALGITRRIIESDQYDRPCWAVKVENMQ
jgi:hypothetical protein